MESEPESTLLSDVTDAVIGVPDAIKKPFFNACSELLGGLVAIPAAKLNQIAQSIRDTTAARTLTSEALAKRSAEKLASDPELAVIAAEAYTPTVLRKSINKINVARSAASHLPTSLSGIDPEKCSAPNDDWMNVFTRFAEDASSERLQDLFGRILAGQVTRPESFGLTTLRVLSELDQNVALDFTHAWALSLGEAVSYNDEWRIGDGFLRWRRLVEAGLMASSTSAQFIPPYKPTEKGSPWAPVFIDDMGILIHLNQIASKGWEHIDFTRVGREIGSILTKPDYERNIRRMVPDVLNPGVMQIDFVRTGKPYELLWKREI
ncbi:DUF2806 domain-containing protein [Pantoea agglomerans]|uniref:DUF2806 domain-containing protein n=1 Tax=Enterobacter agglomerans TaxID=549 RepID=UPI003EBE6681